MNFVNSDVAGRRTGRNCEGKGGCEDLFKWVHHHRGFHVEEPCPRLQNVLLYKGALREGLILDFSGALKADS